VSFTRNYNSFEEEIAIYAHFFNYSKFKASLPFSKISVINCNITTIVFNGVLISCDVEAIIISDIFSIDLAYSIPTISVMSLMIISFATD
jgi:hypothetical protein